MNLDLLKTNNPTNQAKKTQKKETKTPNQEGGWWVTGDGANFDINRDLSWKQQK